MADGAGEDQVIRAERGNASSLSAEGRPVELMDRRLGRAGEGVRLVGSLQALCILSPSARSGGIGFGRADNCTYRFTAKLYESRPASFRVTQYDGQGIGRQLQLHGWAIGLCLVGWASEQEAVGRWGCHGSRTIGSSSTLPSLLFGKKTKM